MTDRTQAETSHISLCADNWYHHWTKCHDCQKWLWSEGPAKCEAGAVLYDEYQSAISAHRDLEQIEATEAKP